MEIVTDGWALHETALSAIYIGLSNRWSIAGRGLLPTDNPPKTTTVSAVTNGTLLRHRHQAFRRGSKATYLPLPRLKFTTHPAGLWFSSDQHLLVLVHRPGGFDEWVATPIPTFPHRDGLHERYSSLRPVLGRVNNQT